MTSPYILLLLYLSFILRNSLELFSNVSGRCRKLRFTIGPIHGHRLENHVIRTIDAINENICKVKCLLEPNCVSYNFKTEANTGGKHKCDLSNASYEHDNEHSGDLAKMKSYLYRGAEVDIGLHIYNIVKISLCFFFAAFFKVTQVVPNASRPSFGNEYVIWVHFDRVKLEVCNHSLCKMSDIWSILYISEKNDQSGFFVANSICLKIEILLLLCSDFITSQSDLII